MKNEPLKIKKRGEDGNRIISVRIREDILQSLDKIASESNYSRNELINVILEYGIKNIEIEEYRTPEGRPDKSPFGGSVWKSPRKFQRRKRKFHGAAAGIFVFSCVLYRMCTSICGNGISMPASSSAFFTFSLRSK